MGRQKVVSLIFDIRIDMAAHGNIGQIDGWIYHIACAVVSDLLDGKMQMRTSAVASIARHTKLLSGHYHVTFLDGKLAEVHVGDLVFLAISS